MKYFKWGLLMIPHALSTLIGGFIFYQLITVGIGFEIILFGPLFITFSFIAFIIPVPFKVFDNTKRYRGIALWITLLSLTIPTLLAYEFLRNLSHEVLVAEFHWDDGIELHLRKNGSYKAINYGVAHAYQHYGRYKIDGNQIIIRHIEFGNAAIKDTLTYDSLGLHFKLEEEWEGITEGVMSIKKNELFKK